MSKGSKPRNNHSTQFRDNYDDISWDSDRKLDKEIEDSFYADETPEPPSELSVEQSEVLMGCVRQSLRSKLYKDTQ